MISVAPSPAWSAASSTRSTADAHGPAQARQSGTDRGGVRLGHDDPGHFTSGENLGSILPGRLALCRRRAAALCGAVGAGGVWAPDGAAGGMARAHSRLAWPR